MLKERYGIIYKITNKVNGKVYIGITTNKKGFKGRYNYKGKGIERVYNYHKHYSKNNKHNDHLLKSIEKYGFDVWEVIEEFDICYSQEELNEKEVYYIDLYESHNSYKGYNKTFGGNGIKHTKETKIKMSKSQKGRKHSEETKRKIGEGKKGEKNYNFGKTLSEETKRKISESNKGKKHSEETIIKMRECKIGELNPMYGKVFSEEHRIRMSESKKGEKHSNCKKIVMLDKNSLDFLSVFKYIRETKEFLNKDNVNHISTCCSGKINHIYGYKWRYLKDYLIENPDMIEEVCNKYFEKYNEELDLSKFDLKQKQENELQIAI